MKRVAVVDIGSNSTRLLIADVDDDRIEEVGRRTDVTRLGDGVDASGRLSDAAVERVFDVLGQYREAIHAAGAERVVGVATSAVRDSANADEFLAALRGRFGIDARTISGDDEARLTFRGATSAHPGSGAPTLVIDIGGGSTEFVVGRPRHDPDFHVSTQAGSVRQSERHLRSDPPTGAELGALREEVAGIIREAVPEGVRDGVERAIAVAGTATSLAAIDQQLEPYDRERVDGYVVTREACERMLSTLAGLPLERRRGVAGLNPKRAPTIVAGAAILAEAMRAFSLESLLTSESDILHGVALVTGMGRWPNA